MERLDKLLALASGHSRKEVKEWIRKGRVQVNGELARSPEQKIDPTRDRIELDGRSIIMKKHIYLMLNKPSGVLSAARDPKCPTVLDLVPPQLRRRGLFPAGRLDKDTTGFVLITNDGDFAHRILSPKNHISKTYHALLDTPVDEAIIARFADGVRLDSGEICLPARLKVLESGKNPTVEVVIHEGMYHQIKRMFGAFHIAVLRLKRVAMGSLALDETLSEGQTREITPEELEKIVDDT